MKGYLKEGFIREITELLGLEEGLRLVRTLETEPSVSIRLNPLKRVKLNFDGCEEMQAVPWCENGFYLSSRPAFTLMPHLHAGAFYVQDASSMILSHIIQTVGSEKSLILDLCAAPGGKTTAIIGGLGAETRIVANEIVPQRAEILRENLIKWGAPNVIVTSAKADKIESSGVSFDIILADVPCSGEGMQRKDEEARKMWSPGLVHDCAMLQREIVSDILPSLRPGGILIYSTCTFNVSENEENVKWLMETYGLENPAIAVEPEWGIGGSVKEGVNALRFMPHRTRGEGLFVALLKKPEDEKSSRKSVKKFPKTLRHPFADKLKGCKELYEEPGVVFALDETMKTVYAALRESGVRILQAGIVVGQLKGKDMVPTVALALSTCLMPGAFPTWDVDKETALRYLAREALFPPADLPKGYVLVKFDGSPLGFIKNLGTRANNLFPKEWRIRNLK